MTLICHDLTLFLNELKNLAACEALPHGRTCEECSAARQNPRGMRSLFRFKNRTYTVTKHVTVWHMIKSFKHKGLSELFDSGRSRRVRQDLQSRCLRGLDALDQADVLNDLNVPGFNFHELHGVP
jgi:hypothetical protein